MSNQNQTSSVAERVQLPNGAWQSFEARRGCGYRKLGGVYVVCDPSDWRASDLVPIDVECCPVCGSGLRMARGLTYFDAHAYWGQYHVRRNDMTLAEVLANATDKTSILARSLMAAERGDTESDVPDAHNTAIIWVGEKYYATPDKFMGEALKLGVSRRVPKLPRGFKAGKTMIMLAHAKAKKTPCDCVDPVEGPDCDCPVCGGIGETAAPQIFGAFLPTRIEVIVKEDTPAEEVAKLIDKGVTPVVVVPVGKNGERLTDEEANQVESE